jgi:hypothetical protein
MIAARQIAFGGSGKKWVNPYVTDGLIVMLDARWNVGGDKFDGAATRWIDLSGNGNDVDVDLTQAYWDDGFLRVTGTTCTRDDEIPNIATLEVLLRDTRSSRYPDNKGSFFVLGERKGPTYLWYSHVAGGSLKNDTAISSNFAPSREILASRSFVYNTPKTYYANGLPVSLYFPQASMDDAVGCKAVAMANHDIEIYHIRAYSRALSAEEIAYNYEIDKARFGL